MTEQVDWVTRSMDAWIGLNNSSFNIDQTGSIPVLSTKQKT